MINTFMFCNENLELINLLIKNTLISKIMKYNILSLFS